ncbi:calmodulin-interacting protein 111 isoform X2 [Malus domestica]|uniref:calmodulin-interacting protein 111 isoform X2 n=1 Tax=Malus domestica TaxID=3750 RepID=UPI003976A321
MPSAKGKKHSKTQSRLSNSSDNFSSNGSLDFGETEEGFASSIEQASIKYPSLIAKSAFVARVADVQDDPKSCKIWLSEPSMVASSFTPGSIVSVSLPSSKSRYSDGFPLCSLADECARTFGIGSCGQLANEAGNYFALATIFPSSKVTKNEVLLSSNLSNTIGCPPSGDNISRLGGLSKEYAVLKDIIFSSSMDTFSSLGLRTTKGVLLHGPPGTGKTSLARLCACDAGINFFSVNGPELVSQYYGESEKALREVFESASQAAPSVVFIDELDAIAPARKEGGEELSQRMVATLLNLMDGVSRTEGVLVIAATNRPDSIEPALRRPGRLDREIEIGVPSPNQRLEILHSLIGEMEQSLSYEQVQHLAIATHGFVGADLAALCNEAAFNCLRRYVKLKYSDDCLHQTSIADEDCSKGLNVPGFSKYTTDITMDYSDSRSSSVSHLDFSLETSLHLKGTNGDGDKFLNDIEGECVLKVTFEDFEKARMRVRPSAMREVILEVPKVNWEDVGGQREVKNQLMEAVIWPQKHWEAFKRIGTQPPTGVLMFGPPGCSKTLMARAVASEAGLNFLAVKGPELFSKWVGESEKAVKSLFAKARANAPAIIFFDEIDGLAAIRGKESDGVSVSDRVMSQLLVELDGLHERVNVTVIAATNRPDKIDSALLRPGRFDRLLYVGPPDETDREEIFHIHLRKIPCSSDVTISELARLSEGCTGADISLICREAAVAAMEESLDASEVKMQHLKTAIKQVKPTEIHLYQELSDKFQRLVLSSTKEN